MVFNELYEPCKDTVGDYGDSFVCTHLNLSQVCCIETATKEEF